MLGHYGRHGKSTACTEGLSWMEFEFLGWDVKRIKALELITVSN